MKRFSGVLALVMALCVITLPLIAQDEQGGRRGGRGQGGPGGGGPGGFGRGMGMGMGMMNGASALLGLLRMEEVRKEVNLSTEGWEAVQKAQREMFSNMGSFRDMSEEERTKAFKEMGTKSQELLDEVLEPAGQKRLMGLLLQQQGNSAVTNDLIAKELSLSEDTVKGIREAVNEAMTKLREQGGGGRGPGAGGGPGGGGNPPTDAEREEMRKRFTAMMEESRKASDAVVDGKLTADQKKAVETLKGAKFTFPENQGFGFGGGRGGPGGGGPGGGRQRPGSDN